ncbi:tetraspanin-33-like isoform X2 [Gigantopelta aegis]|uniref:tetraspanin-33-like isoform X2 n=1 Tax=Gigantopelta aegis TaxID=1735272 RepID=UPI001B88A856|nr:tetraspanin-33-like isoform X2 [Gigantopelta aegis]
MVENTQNVTVLGNDRSAVNLVTKYLIFFVNFMFILLGLALTVSGSYILVTTGKQVTSLMDFLFDPACILTLAGSICVVIAFFGCAGALRENTCFLRTYTLILSILFFLEVALIILVFVYYYVPDVRKSLKLYPEDLLQTAIEKYEDETAGDLKNLLDTIQKTLDCCGLSNNETGYLNWNLNKYYFCNDSSVGVLSCSVPFSCCKIKPGDSINILCGAGVLKKSDPNEVSDKIYTNGCLRGLQVWLDSNIWTFGGIILGILLPQILLVGFARALRDQVLQQKSKW